MTPIPSELLDSYRGKQVHVMGWNPGCTFIYSGTSGGLHTLKTPSTGKVYKTSNVLAYTKRNQPVTP